MNQYSNAALVADMQRCDSLSREDNDRLYGAVKAGDLDARERMVTGNMYLVVEKVNCFVRRYPNAKHLRDDLMSAGFCGLLLAVNAIAAGDVANTNITGYLAVVVGRELEDLMDQENAIHVSADQRRYARQRGLALTFPAVQPLPSGDVDSLTTDPMVMTMLLDTLDACCETGEERVFMEMRAASFTFQEIAAALRVSVGAVHGMKRRLYKRFQRRETP